MPTWAEGLSLREFCCIGLWLKDHINPHNSSEDSRVFPSCSYAFHTWFFFACVCGYRFGSYCVSCPLSTPYPLQKTEMILFFIKCNNFFFFFSTGFRIWDNYFFPNSVWLGFLMHQLLWLYTKIIENYDCLMLIFLFMSLIMAEVLITVGSAFRVSYVR